MLLKLEWVNSEGMLALGKYKELKGNFLNVENKRGM